MPLSDALDDSLRQADYFVDRAKAVAFAGAETGPLGMVGGSSMALARQTQLTHHGEQYRHYTGWPYSIIRIIAQRIAGQPVRVGRNVTASARKRPEGLGIKAPALKRALPVHLKSQAEEIEVLDDHPFIQTLRRPNPIMVQWSMIYVTIASLELTGKAHWWFFVNEEGQLEIWPLPSSWVLPLHDENGLYYAWEIRPEGLAAPMIVPGKDIVLLGYPDPSNPLNHVSPLQANARAVIADEAVEDAQRRSFGNGIHPGLALVIGRHPDATTSGPGTRPILDKAQRAQLIAAVKQQYRGVVNYDEPLILDGLIEDAKRITMGPRELDFLNSAALLKERLTQGWGVNPVSMGQLEGANRASSATADDHLCGNVINPKIVLISQTLTVAVQRIYDDQSLLAYIEEAHAVDPDYELAVETAMVDRAAMDRNEWRARHHLPPIKNGDSVFIGGMEIILERGDEKPGGVRAKSLHCLAQKIGRGGFKALWLKNHNRYERQLVRALRDVIKGFGQEAVQQIEAMGASGPVSSAIVTGLNLDNWEAKLKEAAEPLIMASCLTGATTEWELYVPRRSTGEIAWKALPPGLSSLAQALPAEVQRAVEAFTESLLGQPFWTDVVKNVREDIAASIRTAVEQGESGPEAAKRIERLLGTNGSTVRAFRIARTEVTGALNAGHEATRNKLAKVGLLKGKKWLSIVDDDTREEHKRANGQQVGPGEEFTVGGERATYPGDVRLSAGQRCNCRCASISVTALDDDED